MSIYNNSFRVPLHEACGAKRGEERLDACVALVLRGVVCWSRRCVEWMRCLFSFRGTSQLSRRLSDSLPTRARIRIRDARPHGRRASRPPRRRYTCVRKARRVRVVCSLSAFACAWAILTGSSSSTRLALFIILGVSQPEARGRRREQQLALDCARWRQTKHTYSQRCMRIKWDEEKESMMTSPAFRIT